MIRIGVDGRLLQGKLTGVGKFVLNLIEYICERDQRIHVLIYTNREITTRFKSPGIDVVSDKAVFSKMKPMIWSKLFLHRLINRDKVDVFFAGDALVPLFMRKCPVVSLIHDFNQIIAPKTMSTMRLITDKLFYRKDVLKANLIIANSRGTAEKLKYYFGKTADLIIHPIIDKGYNTLDRSVVKERLKKLGIHWPYVLTVATQEPRKNLDKTIKAFISLKDKGKLRDHKLLLVGSKGWKSGAIRELARLHSADVVTLGYINDETMPWLYNGADVFVFPSSYEGFGMPVREALLCGTKVITNDIAELREASYNQAVYINPEDLDMFAGAIDQAVAEGRSGAVFSSGPGADEDQLDQLVARLLEINT